jgi:NADH:ubiquinone oxidoreductase subunit 4 (subunit M)
MMTEEMMKQMPHMMSQAGHMMTKPMATGAMMAGAGFAAGKGLLGGALLRNPLTLLAVGAAGGIAAGFLLFKYQKEIVEGLSKATGMGKDFALHQKENLNDLMAETQDKFEGNPPPASETPAA